MQYSKLLDCLHEYAESDFALFQKKLIFTKYTIMGVRTPILRKLAKTFQADWREILTFPNVYYEVVFLKLTMISQLPLEEFVEQLPGAVALMDNWALCDQCKAKCISKNRKSLLPTLEMLFQSREEYAQRYVLVTLLTYYMEEGYLPMIWGYIQQANNEYYYVHMAMAWLIAEVLVKFYEVGITWLQQEAIPSKTHNKAIQKAIESYRLTQTEKEHLRSLKIKMKI